MFRVLAHVEQIPLAISLEIFLIINEAMIAATAGANPKLFTRTGAKSPAVFVDFSSKALSSASCVF